MSFTVGHIIGQSRPGGLESIDSLQHGSVSRCPHLRPRCKVANLGGKTCRQEAGRRCRGIEWKFGPVPHPDPSAAAAPGEPLLTWRIHLDGDDGFSREALSQNICSSVSGSISSTDHDLVEGIRVCFAARKRTLPQAAWGRCRTGTIVLTETPDFSFEKEKRTIRSGRGPDGFFTGEVYRKKPTKGNEGN